MVARPGVSVCKDTLRMTEQATTKKKRTQTTQKRLQDKGNGIVEEIRELYGVGPVCSGRGSLDVGGMECYRKIRGNLGGKVPLRCRTLPIYL
jgi:hypothetical protein